MRYLKDENVSDFRKIEEVKYMGAYLDQKASMREKVLRNNGKLLYNRMVGDSYLQAIKFKLQVLDNL